MSWLFSQAMVAAFSEPNCLGGEPSVPSSTTPTPRAFWWPDRTTGHSRLSRFGMTSEPLMALPGEALLTSYRAAFPARTCPQPAEAKASKTGPEADSGRTWPAWFAKFDPNTSSWRTAQCSLLEDWTSFSGTWPRWGSMRSGACSQRLPLVLFTFASASGFSEWATPVTMDKLPPKSPTALAHEYTSARPGRTRPANLRDQVTNANNWPTPQSRDWKGSSGRSLKGLECDLPTAVRRFCTPIANDAEKRGAAKVGAGLVAQVEQSCANGLLNPTWVEWLMGWPIGWTALEDLATDRFREWSSQHSPLYANESRTR